MSILLNGQTPVVVQGITGREGSFWAERMVSVGTNVVAGVTPGKGGTTEIGVPVYNTVSEAAAAHDIEASAIFVPAAFVKDAAFEAIDNGCRLVVILTDGVPVKDTIEICTFAKEKKVMVIGPNTPGIASVSEAMIGFLPLWLEEVYRPGRVGIIARSGSLTNEIASHVTAAGEGISSTIGVGGDMVPGTRMRDIACLFQQDPETAALVIVGELGGSMEEEVAELIQKGTLTKPVIAFIAGVSAPPGKQMGHAGTIMGGGSGSASGKIDTLKAVGVLVAKRPSEIKELLQTLSL